MLNDPRRINFAVQLLLAYCKLRSATQNPEGQEGLPGKAVPLAELGFA
jgi:hypothetical protein